MSALAKTKQIELSVRLILRDDRIFEYSLAIDPKLLLDDGEPGVTSRNWRYANNRMREVLYGKLEELEKEG